MDEDENEDENVENNGIRRKGKYKRTNHVYWIDIRINRNEKNKRIQSK